MGSVWQSGHPLSSPKAGAHLAPSVWGGDPKLLFVSVALQKAGMNFSFIPQRLFLAVPAESSMCRIQHAGSLGRVYSEPPKTSVLLRNLGLGSAHLCFKPELG